MDCEQRRRHSTLLLVAHALLIFVGVTNLHGQTGQGKLQVQLRVEGSVEILAGADGVFRVAEYNTLADVYVQTSAAPLEASRASTRIVKASTADRQELRRHGAPRLRNRRQTPENGEGEG